ncbi:OLC1v1012412C1 [Oldenlandia corymbosa var. corymbosa]|uniref:OLC1v1012412C1 n=1 Tax=Oldenlandia corymbosa var. corymbosa TaxID=529605 RepID=A0AAV1DYC5_OLDCO|nr:OLC1v1012412C1 [Oldenlandia corymbosa var. corymbosa]
MARATRQLTPSSSSATLTVTLTPSSSSSQQQQQQQQEETLVLKLKPKKKKVSWKEGTVDNEFLNKKSSKKCCIFHKEKPFDEDDSEDEDGNAC